jgi:hypothetical protein
MARSRKPAAAKAQKYFKALGPKLVRIDYSEAGGVVIISFIDPQDTSIRPSLVWRQPIGIWSDIEISGRNVVVELPGTRRGRLRKTDYEELVRRYDEWKAEHPRQSDGMFFRRHMGATKDAEVRACRMMLKRAKTQSNPSSRLPPKGTK